MPFLHVTTQVEGDKYQGLLKEKGFRGFPSLAFMDAEGNVLAVPEQRTVKAFTEMLQSLKAWQTAKAKVESGDKAARKDLFLAELNLGKLKASEARAQLAALEGMSKAEAAKTEERIHGLEVKEITEGITRREDMEPAFARLLAMHKAGTIPPGPATLRAYNFLVLQAVQKKDWKLCDDLMATMKVRAKDDAGVERMFKAFEANIAKAKEADARHGGEGPDKK